jgi:hypothetical protein
MSPSTQTSEIRCSLNENTAAPAYSKARPVGWTPKILPWWVPSRRSGTPRSGVAALFDAVRFVRWSRPSSRGLRCGHGCCAIAER